MGASRLSFLEPFLNVLFDYMPFTGDSMLDEFEGNEWNSLYFCDLDYDDFWDSYCDKKNLRLL